MPLYFLKYRELNPLKDLFILGMLVTFVGGSVWHDFADWLDSIESAIVNQHVADIIFLIRLAEGQVTLEVIKLFATEHLP